MRHELVEYEIELKLKIIKNNDYDFRCSSNIFSSKSNVNPFYYTMIVKFD